MKVGIFGECSGKIRDQFLALGHEAYSVDYQETRAPGPHIRANFLEAMQWPGWDLGIFHPTCTYLCSSGLHWNKRTPGRQALTEAALVEVRVIMACKIPRWAIENPIGCISTRIQKPTQIIQPWQFGHPESKGTCLWLKGLPPLVPTNILPPPNSRALAESNTIPPKQVRPQRKPLAVTQSNLRRHSARNGPAMGRARIRFVNV